MPSWKKVILSGSDASLNSLSVATNVTATSFTGSLLGTASFASTASFVTGSNVYGPHGANSILSASYAISSSLSAETVLVKSGDATFDFDGYLTFFSSTQTAGQTLFKDTSGGPKYNPVQNKLTLTGSLEVTGGITGSLLGTSSFATSASFAPNIYNSDGTIAENRTVTLGGNNLTFVADQGETFEIVSNPSSDVSISGLPTITTANLLFYNAGSGQLTYNTTSSFTASQALSSSFASNAATASHGASNFTTAGDVFINGDTEIYGYASVESINLIDPNSSGFSTTSASSSIVPNGNTVTLFTIGSSGFEAVFLDYVVFDSARTNKRVGNFRINFDLTANEVTFDETSTKDIGDTSGFTLFAEVVGSVMSMKAENTTGQNVQIVYERKILYVV
jgi:hypothetical protein